MEKGVFTMRKQFISLIPLLAILAVVFFRPIGPSDTAAGLLSGGASTLVAASDAPLSVKYAADYVADGNGDQEQINAALAKGGSVMLSCCNFYISAPIIMGVVGKYSVLQGQGSRVPTIHAQAGLNDDMIRGAGIQHWSNTIQGLWLVGNRTQQTAGNGINVNGLAGLIIRDVDIADVYQDGIYGETTATLKSDGVVLDNVKVWGAGRWGVHAKSWGWFMTNVQSSANSKGGFPGMHGGMLINGVAEIWMTNVSIDGDNAWGLVCSTCARVSASNLWIGANTAYALGFAGMVREVDLMGFRSQWSAGGVWFMGGPYSYRNIKILGGGISDLQGPEWMATALRFSPAAYQGVVIRDWDKDIGVTTPIYESYVPPGVNIY